MKGITYQQILDYLLGKMSEVDEETFLANCFADDESAEEYEIARDELIESYLRESLSPDDRQRFRDHFLNDPYHRELLRFSENIRGNKAVALAGAAIEQERGTGFFSPKGWLVPVMGVGILVLIAGGITWLFIPTIGGNIADLIPPVDVQQARTPDPFDVPPIIPPGTNVTPGNATRTPGPLPTPRAAPAGGVIIFAIPIAMGPTDVVLRINRGAKLVKLQTEEPDAGYTAYQVVINDQVVDVPNFERRRSKILVPVVPSRFKNGENIFSLRGKKENEDFKDIPGTKRAFLVKTEE